MTLAIKIRLASFAFIIAMIACCSIASTTKAYDGAECTSAACGSVINKDNYIPVANVVDCPTILNVRNVYVPYNVYVPRLVVNRLPGIVLPTCN